MADKKDSSTLSVIGKSIVSTNVDVAAMCIPYSESDNTPPPPPPRVSKSLIEENIILMAEAKAKIEAKAKAEAEAEARARARAEAEANANSKPQMRYIEPYDDTPKVNKSDKMINKIKKLYGF